MSTHTPKKKRLPFSQGKLEAVYPIRLTNEVKNTHTIYRRFLTGSMELRVLVIAKSNHDYTEESEPLGGWCCV